MTSHREGIFVDKLWVEKESGPLSKENVPPVPEMGLTSAPLASLSFHLAQACEPYTRDFTLCKGNSNDPSDCLQEGRKVTRCAMDLIQKVKANCDSQWSAHWNCLDKDNHFFYKCRAQERVFNDCVFSKLGLSKIIPETPAGQEQIHEKKDPLFK